jgi:MerC mercury resistance protein
MGITYRTTQPSRSSLDVMGATASLACAVHCAVVALFLGALPAAASVLGATWIEWVFLTASTMLGLAALVPGYRMHRWWAPLGLFAVGIVILVTLRAVQAAPSFGEMLLVVIAAVCLIAAHWQNRGAMHRCACGPAHHLAT